MATQTFPSEQTLPSDQRSGGLSASERADLAERFDRDGFVVVPDALSPAEVTALTDESVRICRGDAGAIGGNTPDATESLDDLDDAEVLRRYLCIHYPDKISEIAAASLHAKPIVDVLTTVIGPNVKSMQSMLFLKSEGKPGQPWHQDEYFIPTRDRSLTASWIALDDATVENGCLWVLPGSHRAGVLYPAREQDDPEFDCSIEAYGYPYEPQDAIPVELPAGHGIVFNGYLLHRSLKNSGRHGFRRSIANHYMSAESLLPWGQWDPTKHAAIQDDRDIVMIAGEDPYAYKGTVDHHTTYSRPDKDGGCDR